MHQKQIEILFHSLVVGTIISVALGYNPACSAVALALLFSYRIADKYFHDTFFDENKQAIALVKTDLAKVMAKQSKTDLTNALSGNRG